MLGVESALDIHNGASADLWCAWLIGGSQFTGPDRSDSDAWHSDDGSSQSEFQVEWEQLLKWYRSDNILRTFSVANLPQPYWMSAVKKCTILDLIIAFLGVFPTAMIRARGGRR